MGWMAREVGRALLLLWLASLAAFAVIRAMPADPAVITLLAFNLPVSDASVAALHHQWGLDRPLHEQYLRWLGDFLGGDWRRSFRTGEPILTEFGARLPVSLTIGLGGLGLAILLAVPLAEAAARRPHGWADHALDALTLGAQAVPAFWIASVLIWIFAVEFAWLRPLAGPTVERMILPIVIVALTGVGPLAAVYRAGMNEVGRSHYYQVALGKGGDPPTTLVRHGRRYAAMGLAAALTAEASWVIGGTAVVEVVFGLPGISHFLVESLAARDYFVVQAYLMVAVAWMVAVALTAQIVRHLLDPRERSRPNRSA
ncbi:MAG: ABC transporter permease [Alphaproteobacteria bacterium]|nr:ABC transporter permease [Alphaproteobacteria bacterium]